MLDCPPLAEPVYVDRSMWEKIVLNLMSNAFKFTFEGEIAISLRQVAQYAELAVSDTGTGIPEHELPHLFERFHRVERACGRTYEGSGIGLALVQELAKLHGGTVRAESATAREAALPYPFRWVGPTCPPSTSAVNPTESSMYKRGQCVCGGGAAVAAGGRKC